MNNNQTVEKLRQMRLIAMANLHLQNIKDKREDKHTADEYLALLTDHEWDERQNKKIGRLIKNAGFKENASIATVNYAEQRNLDKNMFVRLATLDFINKHENIIVTGSTGVGKSFLAQAIGNQACIQGYKVFYSNSARLFAKLKLSKVDGTYIKELDKLQKNDLLIFDDFGLQSLDNHAREALMDIIDQRFKQKSTIIASQIPVSAWYDIIGEGTIADAILDRQINSSHRMDLIGESMRKGILKNE